MWNIAYRVSKEKTFTLKEGDAPQPLQFNMPDAIDMSLCDIEFRAYESSRRTIFHKKSKDGNITVDGQLVTILFALDDLRNKAGKHRWEAQVVSKTDTGKVITVGNGPLIIYNDNLR